MSAAALILVPLLKKILCFCLQAIQEGSSPLASGRSHGPSAETMLSLGRGRGARFHLQVHFHKHIMV